MYLAERQYIGDIIPVAYAIITNQRVVYSLAPIDMRWVVIDIDEVDYTALILKGLKLLKVRQLIINKRLSGPMGIPVDGVVDLYDNAMSRWIC